jgi:hypothetical protein
MEHSDVISARYEPGFGWDLTSWKLFIGRDRRLRQEVSVYLEGSPYHKQLLRFRTRLLRRQLADLWEILDRIGFRGFNREYTHETISITDRPVYTVTVRFLDRRKEVEAYDLPCLADSERQPDMIGFQELWKAIILHAPFGKVPMEAGLPRPWWRWW